MPESNTAPHNKRIVLVTLPNGLFGSSGSSWKILDIKLIKRILQNAGNDVSVVSIDEILQTSLNSSDVVFYTSSENPSIRKYITDVMFFVNKLAHIVPRYELLLAHENKGFQELAKLHDGFGNLAGSYHFDPNQLVSGYPYVFKNPTGAGSSGVKLVKNDSEKRALLKRCFSPSFKRRIILLQRKLKLSISEYKLYEYVRSEYRPFVKQDFIPDLAEDYKLLIFGKSIYTLRRKTRKNDFRASGSGNFQFDAQLAPEALDFAGEIFAKLDAPFASLDIAKSDCGFHLIEYQCMNFGPIAHERSSLHYEKIGGKWAQVSNTMNLSESYAHSFLLYLEGIKS